MLGKYGNNQFTTGVPTRVGDRQYSQDRIRDFWYLAEQIGLSVKDLVGKIPACLQGGIVTQGTSTSLNITAGYGYAEFITPVADTWASTPPATINADVGGVRIEWAAQTNMGSVAGKCSVFNLTTDGVTINYCKVKYLETNLNSRQRAKAAGTYSYEVTPDYTFVVNAVAPTDEEIELARFTSSAGTHTFLTSIQHRTDTHLLGDKIGMNLKFNSTTTPPIITSGVMENMGNNYRLASDTTLALATHNFMSSRAAFDTYQWYRVIQDSRDGAFRFIHSFDTTSLVVTDNAISNIAVAGTTATITCASTAGLVVADGHIVVIKVTALGAGTMTNLIGRVTNVVDPTHFTVETSYAGTSPGAVTATYSAYFRIQTVQGGAASIIVDASVEKYTPSMINGFCAELNGYYLDINGVETTSATSAIYRVLGVFYVHTGPVVEYVYSYKSGKDKNDNYAFVHGVTSCGAVNNKIPIYNTILYVHGSDYTYGTSGDAGASFTINSDRPFSANMAQALTTSAYVGISFNSTNLTTAILSLTPPEAISCVNTASNATHGTPSFTNKMLKKDSVIRPHLFSNAVSNTFLNSFELSSISQ